MPRIKLGIIIAVIVIALIIVAQNTEAVACRILFFTITAPRAVLLGVMFGAGCVVGMLIAGRFFRLQIKSTES